MYLFLQENVDICFIAVETCFLGKKCFFIFWVNCMELSVLRLKNVSLLKIFKVFHSI